MVSLILWNDNPYIVSSLLPADTELARLTSLAEHPQRGQERPGSDVDCFSKTVIILVEKLVSGVVHITQDHYTSHLVNS